MKFNPQKCTFGRHETFPLRYGWLTKAIQTINEQGVTEIFKQPEIAMIEFWLVGEITGLDSSDLLCLNNENDKDQTV